MIKVSAVDSIDLWLGVIYALLGLVVIFQLARILYYKHNLYSFQFTFLLLCLVFALLRGVWFIFLPSIILPYCDIFEWLPVNIELATFSMLIVFYSFLAHRSTWKGKHRLRALLLYGLTNTLFFGVLTGVFIYRALNSNSTGLVEVQPLWLDRLRRGMVAVVFIVLSVTLVSYSCAVNAALEDPSVQVALRSSSLSSRKLSAVTGTVFVLFMSRALWALTTVIWTIDVHPDAMCRGDVHTNTDGLWYYEALSVASYLAWEVVPTFLVIWLFWRIPSTGRARFKANLTSQTSEHGHKTFEYSRPAMVGAPNILYDNIDVFSNPQRYDSDDETAPLLFPGSFTHAAFGSINTRLASGDYTPYSTTPFGDNTPPLRAQTLQEPSHVRTGSSRKRTGNARAHRSTRTPKGTRTTSSEQPREKSAE